VNTRQRTGSQRRTAGHTGTSAGLAALAGLRLVRPHAITGVICTPGGAAGLGEDRRPAAAVQRAEGVNPGDLEQHPKRACSHGRSA